MPHNKLPPKRAAADAHNLPMGSFGHQDEHLPSTTSHSPCMFRMWLPQLMQALDLAFGLFHASRQKAPLKNLTFVFHVLMPLPQLMQAMDLAFGLFQASRHTASLKKLTFTFRFSCGCRSCCRWWILPLGIKTNISPQNPLHIQIFTFMAEALPFPHVPVHRLGPGNE